MLRVNSPTSSGWAASFGNMPTPSSGGPLVEQDGQVAVQEVRGDLLVLLPVDFAVRRDGHEVQARAEVDRVGVRTADRHVVAVAQLHAVDIGPGPLLVDLDVGQGPAALVARSRRSRMASTAPPHALDGVVAAPLDTFATLPAGRMCTLFLAVAAHARKAHHLR